MNLVHLILIILALACFFLAAIEVTFRRTNLLGAGLLFWLLATLVLR